MPTITSEAVKLFAKKARFINVQNPIIPICSNWKLSYSDTALAITKTDSKNSAILVLDKTLQIDGEGEYLIEEAQLLDFANAYGPVIELTESTVKGTKNVLVNGIETPTDTLIHYIELRCGKAKRKLQTDGIKDYPTVPQPSGDVFEIEGELMEAVKMAANYVSTDALRPWIMHVNFQGKCIFGTDGHMVYRYEHSEELPVYSLPAMAIQALPVIGIAALSQRGNYLFIEADNFTVGILKEDFKLTTPINSVIPSGNPVATVTLEKAAILPILGIAERSPSKSPEVNLEVRGNNIRAWAFAMDWDISDEDTIPATVTGELSRTCVNAAYLRKALLPFNGLVTINDHGKGLIVKEGKETVLLMKLMVA